MPSGRQMSHVVLWCAEECERQRSGERSVSWMFEGWRYAARHRNHPPVLRDVLALGRIVEPRKAMDGLRRCGVRVGRDVKMDWQQVPGALRDLLEAVPWWDEASAAGEVPRGWQDRPTYEQACAEWYRQYEEIHPFADGNGRTGSLLFNWLLGTLNNPVVPPDFWADPAGWQTEPDSAWRLTGLWSDFRCIG